MKNRLRERMCDTEILDLIFCGVLEVDLETGGVFKDGISLKATRVGARGRNGVRYRYEICWDGAKRTIARGRIVYMAGSRAVIPDGCEIHHIDGDSHNDVWSNLICLALVDHLKLHGKCTSSDEVPF